MKKILIIVALLFSVIATAQQYHDKGAKFENATSVGDTISNNTRIPIIDEFGLVNYYVDVADLLALNPVPPASDLQAVTEVGATTTINMTIPDGISPEHAINKSQLDGVDSDLQTHKNDDDIHFTQAAININESQITDLNDYLRGDINDTNGANKLTLGSLDVTGQTILQNGLNMTSVPVGTSDNILTLNQTTGDVEQRVFSLGDIDIANAAGTNQFPIGLGDQLRFEGSGDTSISFDGVTNTINITSVPGSGTGGAVTSFNGRTGGVVSQAGDYSTAMVNENTNLYFTEPRVRATPLTGLTVTNTPISSTNTFIQALGRLQGQINDRITGAYTGFDSRYYTETEADSRFLYSTLNDIKTNGYTRFIPSVQWGENGEVGTFYDSGSNEWRLDFGTNALVRFRNSGYGDAFTWDVGTGNSYTSGNGTFANGVSITGGHLNMFDFRRAYFGTNNDSYIVYDGSGDRLNMILESSVNDFRIMDGTSERLKIDRVTGNTTISGNLKVSNQLDVLGSSTGTSNASYLRLLEANGTTRQGLFGFSTSATSDLDIVNDLANARIRIQATGASNQLRFIDSGGNWTIWHSGNSRGDAQNDSRYALQSTTINAGTGLTGGGNLSSNRTLSVDFGTTAGTVMQGNNAYTKGESDGRFVNNTGSETMTGYLRFTDNTALQFGSDNDSQLSYGSTNDDFRLDGGKIFKIRTAGFGTAFEFNPSTGNMYASGTITGSNLSGTNTGDQTLSGLGGVPTSRTITAGDGLTGGGNLSSNRTLSVDGTVARMNTTNSGSLRASGNIISDSNIQASSAIISGAGSFGGRVSGSDAINANEFVTRQQVVPLSTQQTGVVRAIEAISSALTVDDGVYMEKGGVQYVLTVPAGTFQQSGRGILDIEGIMEMSNITQDKTLSVYITFSQAGTVYNSDPMSFDLSTTGGGAFGHFKATLTSRMSAGYFFGKGVVTGSDSNGSITQGFTINPPTSLDFRQSFTIRMRVSSTTGYNMVLIPFTVKVSDLPN